MGKTLTRHLGSEETIEPGQFVHALRHTTGCMTTVVVCCPSCSTKTTLTKAYTVARDGSIAPAFSCSNKACGFLEFLFLDGWGLHI